MKIKNLAGILLAAGVATTVLAAGCGGGNKAQTLSNQTVYLVGDSTVCSFTDQYYLPRYGYGTQIGGYLNLDESASVNNLALSGRSSYSFMQEENYNTLKTSIKSGDYLIIGFGHNDEKTEPQRYMNANLPTNSEEKMDGRYVSFKRSLYENYIKVATDKGATPILCTPIVRLSKDDNYSGAKAHITADVTDQGVDYAGGDYAKAIRELGAEKNVTVIDLTELTKADYSAKKYAVASKYHAATSVKLDANNQKVADGIDETHTNLYGAKMNAYYIASELKKSSNSLGKYVKDDIAAPTEADYAAGIVDMEVKDYEPFNAATTTKSVLGTNITKEGWYATAFGDLGSDNVLANYIVEQVGDNFKVGNETGKGKITSSADGMAAAFYQIGVNKNFKISATVTLDKYPETANQTGFGLMLRDDIYIDARNKGTTGNYVAAGAYGTSTATNVIFSRAGATITPSGNKKNYTQGDSINLSIEKNNQTVIVTFGEYSETYTDFDFVKVDGDYMYICLFATRNTVATFSNIVLENVRDGVSA